MSELRVRVPSLRGGISEQPAHMRLPDQVEDAVNVILSVVDGAQRRPGTEWTATLDDIPPLANLRLHPIDRDEDERYIVVYGAEALVRVIEVPPDGDAIEAHVTISPEALVYLNRDDPTADDFRYLSILDYTLIANAATTAGLLSSPDYEASSHEKNLTILISTTPAALTYHEAIEDDELASAGFWRYDPAPGESATFGTHAMKEQAPSGTASTDWTSPIGAYDETANNPMGFDIAFGRVDVGATAVEWDESELTLTKHVQKSTGLGASIASVAYENATGRLTKSASFTAYVSTYAEGDYVFVATGTALPSAYYPVLGVTDDFILIAAGLTGSNVSGITVGAGGASVIYRGLFEFYEPLAGDQIRLTGGTDITVGWHMIDEKVDDRTIRMAATVASPTGDTSDAVTDSIGRLHRNVKVDFRQNAPSSASTMDDIAARFQRALREAGATDALVYWRRGSAGAGRFVITAPTRGAGSEVFAPTSPTDSGIIDITNGSGEPFYTGGGSGSQTNGTGSARTPFLRPVDRWTKVAAPSDTDAVPDQTRMPVQMRRTARSIPDYGGYNWLLRTEANSGIWVHYRFDERHTTFDRTRCVNKLGNASRNGLYTVSGLTAGAASEPIDGSDIFTHEPRPVTGVDIGLNEAAQNVKLVDCAAAAEGLGEAIDGGFAVEFIARDATDNTLETVCAIGSSTKDATQSGGVIVRWCNGNSLKKIELHVAGRQLTGETGPRYRIYSATHALAVGAWAHVVVSYDSTLDACAIYVNGSALSVTLDDSGGSVENTVRNMNGAQKAAVDASLSWSKPERMRFQRTLGDPTVTVTCLQNDGVTPRNHLLDVGVNFVVSGTTNLNSGAGSGAGGSPATNPTTWQVATIINSHQFTFESYNTLAVDQTIPSGSGGINITTGTPQIGLARLTVSLLGGETQHPFVAGDIVTVAGQGTNPSAAFTAFNGEFVVINFQNLTTSFYVDEHSGDTTRLAGTSLTCNPGSCTQGTITRSVDTTTGPVVDLGDVDIFTLWRVSDELIVYAYGDGPSGYDGEIYSFALFTKPMSAARALAHYDAIDNAYTPQGATFDIDVIDWNARTNGDIDSNPAPSILTDELPVDDMAFYEDRLVLAGRENIVFSQSGDLFNLFLDDADEITDADPIDTQIPSTRIADVQRIAIAADTVLIFTQAGEQFELDADGPLTPASVRIKRTTTFTTPPVRPCEVGDTTVFLVEGDEGTGLYEYRFEEFVQRNRADELTAHARRIVGPGARNLQCYSNRGMSLILPPDGNEIVVHFQFSADSRRRQSALARWVYDPAYRILDIAVLQDLCYLLVDSDGDYVLEAQPLEQLGADDDWWERPHLDRRMTRMLTIEPSGDTAEITVPFGDTTLDTVVAGEGAAGAVEPGSTLDIDDIDGDVVTVTDDAVDIVGSSSPSGAGLLAVNTFVTVGRRFESSVTLTRPFARDQEGVARRSDWLQVQKFTVDHVDAGAYTIRAALPLRSDRTLSFDPGERVVQAAGFSGAWHNGVAEDLVITLETDDPRPCTWTSGEWQCDHEPRRRGG